MGAHVGAGVEVEAVAQGEQGAVGAQGDGGVVDLLARVVERAEVLLAVLGPAHRLARAQRAERDEEVLGVELAATAEAAAHVELDQAHAVLGQAEQRGEDAAVGVHDLGRAPHGHPAAVGALGHEPARLHRHGAVTLAVQALLDDEVGLGEGGVDVPEAHVDLAREVGPRLGVQHRALGVERRGGVEQGVERLVRDRDQLERVLGRVARVGQHHRDRLARVAHEVLGQRRLEQPLHTVDPEHAHGDARQWVRQVVARDDVDHALVLERGRGVDRDDARVCMRAPQDRRVQRARALEVVDEAASAGEEPTVLLAPQRAPDDALGVDARYHRYLISTQAPRRVALAAQQRRGQRHGAGSAHGAECGGRVDRRPAALGGRRGGRGQRRAVGRGGGCGSNRRGRRLRLGRAFGQARLQAGGQLAEQALGLGARRVLGDARRRDATVHGDGDARAAVGLGHLPAQERGRETGATDLVHVQGGARAAAVLVGVDRAQRPDAGELAAVDLGPHPTLEGRVAVDAAQAGTRQTGAQSVKIQQCIPDPIRGSRNGEVGLEDHAGTRRLSCAKV